VDFADEFNNINMEVGEGVEVQKMPSKEELTSSLNEIFKATSDAALIGGVGCDILLHGDIIGPHKDIDMVADVNKSQGILTALQELGYKGGIEKTNVEKIKLFNGNVEVGIGLLQSDRTGGVQTTYEGSEVHFDKSILGEDKNVGGVKIKVASPLGIIQTLNLPSALGGIPSEKHVSARVAIGNKYFPGETTDGGVFIPEVVRNNEE